MLIIVETGNVQFCAQAPLDLETARRGNVFQVDAAVYRSDCLNDGDDFVDVLRIETHRPRINLGEALEQREIGRASCRERGQIQVDEEGGNKKHTTTTRNK